MKQYYIISLKHTSKGDTALLFWGPNGGGYTCHRDRVGVYNEDVVDNYTSEDNVKVEKEKVDPFWMNAVDHGDTFIAIANTSAVRKAIGISDRLMKPKKYAGIRMAFMNTPVAPMATLLLLILFLASCGPSKYLECPKYVGVVIPDRLKETYKGGLLLGTEVYQQIGHADTFRIIRSVPPKPDTVPEWMHVSMRDVGFVVARKALSVRIDGICTTHLDCAGKPFPAHYHVGWCQGKELLLNRLVKGRGR